MTFRQSTHNLPLNNALFESVADLHPLLPANATLVNLQDAADNSITALPTPPAPEPEPEDVGKRPSFWRRMLAKIKHALRRRGSEGPDEEREMDIGGPTDFQHHSTGGEGALRGPVAGGRRRVEVMDEDGGRRRRVEVVDEEEEEWEDVVETKRYARG